MTRFLAATGLGLLTLAARAEINPEYFQKLCFAVQMIQGTAPDGRLFIGSGVLVAPGRAVTNCHVVRESSRIAFGRPISKMRTSCPVEARMRNNIAKKEIKSN